MDCKIINDLLPLYCDGQASAESAAAVEAHLQECSACREAYRMMSGRTTPAGQEASTEQEMPPEQMLSRGKGTPPEQTLSRGKGTSPERTDPAGQNGDEEDKKVIDLFKKIRTRGRVKLVLTAGITAVCCMVLFFVLFYGVVPADSQAVTITPQVKADTAGQETHEYYASFHLETKNGRCIDVRGNLTDPGKSMTVYTQFKLPFDDRGKAPDQFDAGYAQDHPFTEQDVIRFRFRDKTVEYRLKELAEQAGLQ